MTKKKKSLIFIILLVILIQFIPIPKNNGTVWGADDITHTVAVNPSIKKILSTSCNDCHSDSTHYFWYFKIQPLAWWLNNHISKGKKEVNFTVFNTYSNKRKLRKFQEIIEQVSSDEMPLGSYTLIHHNAKLSAEQKLMLIEWAEAAKRSIAEPE